MNLQKSIFFSILILLISFSCTNNKHQAKKEKEVKAKDINVDIIRFDKELFACDPNNLDVDLIKLNQKYPTFYNVFYNQILHLPEFGDKGTQLNVMQDFITKKAMVELYDTIQISFSNIDFLKEDLTIAFANYKSYYPEKPIPKVVTCITEFSIAAFTVTDSIIGISLDMYLGPKYKYYPSLFSEFSFMIPTFDKKYLAIDCVNVLADNLVVPPDEKSTLLDKMIAKGKTLYIMHCFLPQKREYDIIKYNEKQWKFCLDNETQIWSYFLNHDLLYNSAFEQFKYVTEAPTTYGMPKETPGRVGAWLGWQIVRGYMKENPNTTLRELVNLKDGQKILIGSKYKPKTS